MTQAMKLPRKLKKRLFRKRNQRIECACGSVALWIKIPSGPHRQQRRPRTFTCLGCVGRKAWAWPVPRALSDNSFVFRPTGAVP